MHHQPPISFVIYLSAGLSTTHVFAGPQSWLQCQSPASILPYHVGRTVNHPCLYSPTLSAALSVTHLLSPLLCQLHRQSCILLLTHPGGCTINHPCLYSPTESAALSVTRLCTPLPCRLNCQPPKPTLSVALLITHPLNPVSCQLHRQLRISLLPHPGSRTVSHYLFTPYRVGRTVNHPYPPCRLHC